MPTWTATKLPPPAKTNAVFGTEKLRMSIRRALAEASSAARISVITVQPLSVTVA
jgi:hypothetical protein